MKFEPGLTGLVGPNGSGKTTAMSAAYAGITGDWSRFEHDKREHIISQYASPSEPAGVRVLMEHHGVRAEITRMLRPNTRQLVIGTEEPVTADKAIAAKIEKWFGLPLKVIGQYIFVNQWEMFSILSETATERSKDLYRLFGIEQAEQCWAALGDHIKELSEKTPEVDVDAVRTRLLSNRNRLRELDNKLRDLQNRATSDDNLAFLQATVDGWENVLRLQDKINDLEYDIQAIGSKLHEAREYADRTKADRDSFTSRLAELDRRFAECAKAEAEWKSYKQVSAVRSRLEGELTKLNAQNSARPKPERGQLVVDDLYGEVYNELRKSEKQLEKAEEYLRHINEGVSVCPVCYTPVEQLKDQIDKFKLDVETLTPKVCRMRASFQETVKYREALKEWNEWKANFDAHYEHVWNSCADVPHVEPPSVSEQEIVDVKEDYRRSKVLLAGAENLLAIHAQRVSKLEGEWEARCADRDNLTKELYSIDISQKDADAAKAVLDVRQLEKQERDRLQVEMNVIRRSISDDENTLEEAAAVMKEAEKVDNFRSELTAVRDIMHREALPRMVAQSQLSLLESQMNKSLEELGIDFRVKAKDGLKFQVVFNDGVRQVPAETLSGGEKVVFALAWRLAVNAQFAGDIGVLCLDEPTAGLDKDRLGCLKLAIEKMKAMSQSRGLQCVIITHAEGLMPLFDRVIELHPPQPS